MSKEKAKLIRICNFEALKKFAKEVSKFESDINIYSGSKYYDAKSIMGILALNMSEPRYVEIISDDPYEIKRFNDIMSEFA